MTTTYTPHHTELVEACMCAPVDPRRAPLRPEESAIRSIVIPGQEIERRLVRNPARRSHAVLFAGWGPRLGS
jgi:hypothetical protein